jgi:hypothetical protein
MQKPDDPIKKEIPCECGKPNCNMGLIIEKYPGDKIKIQIFEGDEIKTVVVNKEKLLEKLK